MDVLSEILGYFVGGNLVMDYSLALAVFAVSIIALKIFKFFIITKLKKLSAKTKTKFDDIVVGTVDRVGWKFYLFLSFYLAIQVLILPSIVQTLTYYVLLFLLTYYGVMGIQDFIDYATQHMILKRKKEVKDADTSIISLLNKVMKGVLWGIAILLILSNLGYDVSTIAAGLGIGGLAVAFALQNVLSDIFASVSIYFDKPFKVGDYIVIGTDRGVVKSIGIKSTRIQTLLGEELVISNKELTETRVHNYKKMRKRRVSFSFGVTYQTPVKKLKKIPKIVADVISKLEQAELDRVHFTEFGDFSLNFGIVYYVKSSEYKTYKDIQQQINLSILEKFEKEKIEMAYPTQTIFLTKTK